MRLRDERGFTLPELLVAMIVFAFVMLATFGVFDNYYRLSATNNKQNDSVEESRVTIDQVTRQLRNLASPTTPKSTIDTAEPYNLIFQTDDPAKTWVRYCLVTTGSGATAKGTLYYATSTSSTLSDTQKGACPGYPWNSVQHVAPDVTNTTNGQDRPIFGYTCTAGSVATCPSSSSDNSKIVLSAVNLYVDTNPGKAPSERLVQSGVYLRNQNQPPTASFTVTKESGSHSVILNGSASSDPEGRTLHYYWCRGSLTGDCSMSSSGYIGTGVTFNYLFPPSDSAGDTVQISLTVVDPGGLSATTIPPQNVIVPT